MSQSQHGDFASSASSTSFKKVKHQGLNIDISIHRPKLLIQLEKEGIRTAEDQAARIVERLASPEHLYALKFLLENPIGYITSKDVLIDALLALTTPEKPKYFFKAAGISFGSEDVQGVWEHMRKACTFKYPIGAWYIDWRLVLFIQHTLDDWCKPELSVVTKKYAERILLEHLWFHAQNECAENAKVSSTQNKFEEISRKVLKSMESTTRFLTELLEIEPITSPGTLLFGVLDLVQNLVDKTNESSTIAIGYFLAVRSLDTAQTSFIRFKAIEVLLHIQCACPEMFFDIEQQFDDYIDKNDQDKSSTSLTRLRNLFEYTRAKVQYDYEILHSLIHNNPAEIQLDNVTEVNVQTKGKAPIENKEAISEINHSEILGLVSQGMTCSVEHEPSSDLWFLECGHTITRINLPKLRKMMCPVCRDPIKEEKCLFLPQHNIYNAIYSRFIQAETIDLTPDVSETRNKEDSSDDDIVTLKKENAKKAFSKNKKNGMSVYKLVDIVTLKKKTKKAFSQLQNERGSASGGTETAFLRTESATSPPKMIGLELYKIVVLGVKDSGKNYSLVLFYRKTDCTYKAVLAKSLCRWVYLILSALQQYSKILTSVSHSSDYISTECDCVETFRIKSHRVVIDDQPCILEILGIAVEAEYPNLCDKLIRDGDGFLLVYSITSRITFEQIGQFMHQITRVKEDNLSIMLVGNNCTKITEREVSREEGMNLARFCNCGFIESCPGTGVNVERAFYNVARMIRASRSMRY
ncbi:200_t:CDS:2 [Ambispora gerdemannii]|uniref:200_t:CDS:1 n=1 Tax=Ambispora gerdemannii TaxID=144530 RepID=A0A9N8WB55_9GLOM|nr:200_t:CDS:2 [Ambispora gerdemannii]